MAAKAGGTRAHPPPPTSRPKPKPIPGPPALPWLGVLPAFLSTKFFPQTMLKWTEEYGGVYRIEIVGKRYVVVTDAWRWRSAWRACPCGCVGG